MNLSRNPLTAACRVLLAALALFAAGCVGILHTVTVDAITDPAAPTAFSYQLVPKRPTLVREARLHASAVACVEAALAARGLFAAAGPRPADIVIELDYGVGNTIPLPNSAPMMEKFLSLSARKYSATATKNPELWNVRVVVSEAGAGLDRALPLLAAVAVDYAGMDTGSEKSVTIPDRSPAIVQVRNAGQAAAAAVK